MDSRRRLQGRLSQWNDDKGFGDILTYATARDAQGRLQATAIRFATAPVRPAAAHRRGRVGLALAGAFALALAGPIATGRLPVHVGTLYGVMSVIMLIVCGADRWRTPEVHLHLLALLGGWSGALLARRWFRHKSNKAEFQGMFWVTVCVNLLALGWYVQDVFNTATGVIMLVHSPGARGDRTCRNGGSRPALRHRIAIHEANRSVARTSASVFSASNAEWPDAGEIISSAFGQALCRSQAFWIGQTTS